MNKKVDSIFDKMQNTITHEIFLVPKFRTIFEITGATLYKVSDIFDFFNSRFVKHIQFFWNFRTRILSIGVSILHYIESDTQKLSITGGMLGVVKAVKIILSAANVCPNVSEAGGEMYTT